MGTAKSGAAEMSNTPYLDRARLRFPEVLSRIDQEPFSLTYGCGDRNYWGWKFTDFPGARFQEFLFTLAWIKTASPDDCIWRNSAFLDDTIKAGFCWWRHIQHADGSFDEAYPNEKSLAATAFTLFYASESFVRIRNTLAPEEQRKTLEAMHRAADWLCQNDETHGVLSNHLAAAAAALWNAHGLLGEAAHRDRAEHFIRRIRSRQSKEGWYEEYGGADIGYQTHCSFYLARIWQKSRDGELLESLRRANAFLSHFVHPDGSIGGEYASRGTKFYFPAAFEMLWEECDVARSIAEFQRVNIAEGRGIGVGQMDEYNLYPMLNNYLFAEDAHRSRRGVGGSSNPLPWQKEQCVLFEDAGLAVESRRRHFAIIGVGGGGVLRIWDKDTRALVFQNTGYVKDMGNHWITTRAPSTWKKSESGWVVTNSPVRINQKVFSTPMFLAFRIFNITIGRVPFFATWIKRLLVKVLVSRRSRENATFTREIHWQQNGKLILRDHGTGKLKGATWLDRFLPFHMGSARYIDEQEEACRSGLVRELSGDVDEFVVLSES